MGFRVDGCGTYSGSKVLKKIGEYWCEHCKAVHSFSLYELTEKVTVLYVPVAKLSTRYAVLCDRCKNGYKVSDEQRFRLMSGDNSVLAPFFAEVQPPEPPAAPQKQESLPVPQIAQLPAPTRSSCCLRCGTPIDKSASFCNRCGRRYSAQELDAVPRGEAGEPRVCSQCGGTVPDGMLFCTHCGKKMG